MQKLALWACLAYTVLLIDGCADDIPYLLYESHIVSTIPAEGGIIASNGILTITFDKPVYNVNVEPGFLAGAPPDGITWIFHGKDLTSGAFDISWVNNNGTVGEKNINLKVRASDIRGPMVVSSSPKDGESGIDPAKVAKITVEFDEEVSARGVKLAAVGGDFLQIKAEAKGKIVEITFLGGVKLVYETRYELTVKVKDAVGNETDVKIIFETMKKV